MRVLVISDIHANLTALKTVLEDVGENHAENPPYEAVWCLGDLIGYGPDPNPCIELVRTLPNLICLIGNHDQAALDLIPLSRFNEDARLSATWTRSVLTPENESYLRSLPSQVEVDAFTLVHASPRFPIWEYVLDPYTADQNFDLLETDYCLIGHTHIALSFSRAIGKEHSVLQTTQLGDPVKLAPKMMLNPGSVGQPRDMDPRASYAVLDLERGTWEARRVVYDVEEVQERILQAGLPERQALRLFAGW